MLTDLIHSVKLGPHHQNSNWGRTETRSSPDVVTRDATLDHLILARAAIQTQQFRTNIKNIKFAITINHE